MTTLKQCPINIASMCCMTDTCVGCERLAEHLLGYDRLQKENKELREALGFVLDKDNWFECTFCKDRFPHEELFEVINKALTKIDKGGKCN